jgi:hypothetical protein
MSRAQRILAVIVGLITGVLLMESEVARGRTLLANSHR